MNDRAREALVAAALAGVKQVKGVFRNGEGRCAMGVIIDAYGMITDPMSYPQYMGCLEWAEIDWKEDDAIRVANDNGIDFLTIARKFGNDA